MGQLDSSIDFARAYGTLGWALSKVIPRKDIPQIYTMYNAGVEEKHNREHQLPLEAFRKKREEVVAEVLRARVRHWDNVITSTEDSLRQLSMVVTITKAVRDKVRQKLLEVQMYGILGFYLPGVIAGKSLHDRWDGTKWVFAGFWAAYALIGYGAKCFLWEHCRQFERLQVTDLDTFFEEAYAWFFIHADAEDLRGRWVTVRPRVVNILRAASSVAFLPFVNTWEINRIEETLDKDIWYLRLLAKMLRQSEDKN